MRKIIAGEFISVDGVIETANQLTSQYNSHGLQQYLSSGMATTDTLLLGRVTYQEMSPRRPRWPAARSPRRTCR